MLVNVLCQPSGESPTGSPSPPLGCAGVSCDEGDVKKHLEQGKKLLSEGNLSEALMHYSMAVGASSLTIARLLHLHALY